MRLRLRKDSLLLDKKIDSTLEIDKVLVKEESLDGGKNNISIYTRGKDSSGIITFSQEEAEKLIKSLREKADFLRFGRKKSELD